MSITVEFYGIPRERVGVSSAIVDAATLGEALSELAQRFPDFARDCVVEDKGLNGHCELHPQFVASLGGERFVTDPMTALSASDNLLILSADAGG